MTKEAYAGKVPFLQVDPMFAFPYHNSHAEKPSFVGHEFQMIFLGTALQYGPLTQQRESLPKTNHPLTFNLEQILLSWIVQMDLYQLCLPIVEGS